MKNTGLVAIFATVLAGQVLADGSDLIVEGQVDLGFRHYTEDGRYPEQGPAGSYPFIGLELNAGVGLGPGELVFEFSALADDTNDRSSFFTQKAYYTQSFDNWDFLVGYNVENWGVSNGRTIVNVLNARDRADQIGGSDLIGTPMINANVFTGIGTFSAYVLGGDVNDNFGGVASRHRGPLYTFGDLQRYETEDELDFALRYSNYFSVGAGSLDIGLSYYQGTNREAVSLPGCVGTSGLVTEAICNQINAGIQANYESGGSTLASVSEMATYLTTNFGLGVALDAVDVIAFTPYYQDIRQWGLTAVYAQGDTQLRFEGFLRDTEYEDFMAAIVGGEHAFHDVAGTDGSLILALEYHYDDRSARQPVTVFDNDMFLGFNYSLNDTNDTRFELGAFYDLDSSAQLYNLTVSRRIGERMRAQLSASHVEAGTGPDPLSAVNGDTFLEFSLSTFF